MAEFKTGDLVIYTKTGSVFKIIKLSFFDTGYYEVKCVHAAHELDLKIVGLGKLKGNFVPMTSIGKLLYL